MTTRITSKRTFANHHEVCHVFAQRTHLEGSSGGNVYFYKDRLFSYGSHYVLAEFITNKKGELAVMINNVGYSSSTGKHISMAASATSHYRQFFTTQTNGKLVLNKLTELYEKLGRAKKPMIYINQAVRLYEQFIEYLDWSKTIDPRRRQITLLYKKFVSGDAYEKAKEVQAKADERDRLKVQRDIELFLKYEKDYVPNSKEAFVRISKNGERIETSKGANAPVSEARVLYQLIKAGKDIKGFKIGYYTVIGLNGTLKIGCHDINKQNMVEVGEQLLSM